MHVFSDMEEMINSRYSAEISKLQNENLELQYENQELERKLSLALQQQSNEHCPAAQQSTADGARDDLLVSRRVSHTKHH